MRKALLFIVLLIGQYHYAQEFVPPTDWQVEGLKGRVKKMTVVNIVDDKEVDKMEIFYNTKGYRTNTLIYDKDAEYTEYTEYTLVLGATNIYMEYKDDKRYVLVPLYQEEENNQENGVEEVLKKDIFYTEYWTSDRQQVVVYKDVDSYTKSMYNEDYKPMSKERYSKYSIDGKESVVTSNIYYAYTDNSELIRKDISSKSNNGEEKSYYLYETQKRDKAGNILRRIVQDKEKKNRITEEFSYEYY